MTERIKVWDIVVRSFHWSLVFFFIIAYLSGDELDTVHAYAGYVIAALLIIRLVWGFIGTRNARFVNFIYGPSEVKRYARSLTTRQPMHYEGHNPIGGWMVIALLVSLILTTWSGLEAYGVEGHGPLATESSLVSVAYANGDEGKGNEQEENEDEFWEEIHEALANLTLLLVFVHIGGVLFASLMHGENLIKIMLTGYRER